MTCFKNTHSAVVPTDQQLDVETGKVTDVEPIVRPFPMIGITLTGINHFIEKVGGREVLSGLTTTEVCNKFVIPMTKNKTSSYCDFCESSGDPLLLSVIGTATVFISHAWKYNFLTVVDTMSLHFEAGKAEIDHVFLWFDLFSNNQHGLDEPPPFSWWCDVFMLAIEQIGNVLMIMEPWDNPIPLTRAWCLWEVYCAENVGSKFEVAMSKEASDKFLKTIIELEGMDAFFQMLSNVDVRNSESFNPLDRKQIFDVINKSVGFPKLNRLVIDRLRKWVKSKLKEMKNFYEQDKIMESHFVLANTLFDIKMKVYVENRTHVILCDNSEAALRDLYTSMMYRQNALGNPYSHTCDHESMIRYCLSETTDDNLKFYAKSDQCRSIVEFDLMRMKKVGGIVVVKRVLDEHIAEFGKEHRRTIEVSLLYGMALRAIGKYAEAKEIIVHVLDTRKAQLGQYHPDTLATMQELAKVYLWTCEYKKARNLLEECLTHSVEKFGDAKESEITASVLKQLNLIKAKQSFIVYRFYYHLFTRTLFFYIRCLGRYDTEEKGSIEVWPVILFFFWPFCLIYSIIVTLLDSVRIFLAQWRGVIFLHETSFAAFHRCCFQQEDKYQMLCILLMFFVFFSIIMAGIGVMLAMT